MTPPPNRPGIDLAPRSPVRAALYSLLFPGGGQLYNKQLEKAVLFWIWGAMLLGVGTALLLLGLLGGLVPPGAVRPPLGDWIADHAGGVFAVWLLAAAALWGTAVRDAHRSAERLNRGEETVRYPLRVQMVHVLASQILGSIPLVGLFFPPAVGAEAMESLRDRRRPERRVLLEHGRQAVVEWAITRLALYGLVASAVLWVLWWLLRAARLAP